MPIDTGRIISALVEAQATVEQGERMRYRPRGNVVTLAHDLGSGGRAIAQRLAERLGVRYYDRQVANAILAAAPEDKTLMARLDQRVESLWDEVLQEVIAGRSALDQYRRRLVGVILAVASESGVIVGRGANLILSRHKVFRVRIVGSPEVCAQRLLERGEPQPGMKREQVLKRVMEARSEDAAFIRQYFTRDPNDWTQFDLVLNTDSIPLETAVNIIIEAMRHTGFAVGPLPVPHAV
jgi:cytidylate kinase